MNPADPSSYTSKYLKLSTGRTYHYIDEVPTNYDSQTSTIILCVHGFPDFWYGWRYQIPQWVQAGHRVIAPDMLGYGGSDKPFKASEYTTKKLCADLVALLDESTVAISGKPPVNVVVVGHDWGSYTAGRFALWYPERLKGLILLSVPYTPPSPVYIPIEQVVQIAPNLEYQAYFARQEATKDLDLNVPRVVQLLYGCIKNPEHKPKKSLLGDIRNHVTGGTDLSLLSSVLNENEKRIYEEVLQKGMNGPLNYYRTYKHRHDEEAAARLPPSLRDDIPVLFMWGNTDVTVFTPLVKKASKFIKRLTNVEVDGVGHWITVDERSRDLVVERVLQLIAEVERQKGKL